MSVFTGCVISCFSALLLKVHATHLPTRQKLIKIILQLCYQMVWGICFGFSNACQLWSGLFLFCFFGFVVCFFFFLIWNDGNWKIMLTILANFVRNMSQLGKKILILALLLIHAVKLFHLKEIKKQ